ncbi:MAG TPA: glycosyltransferase family 39 protein, partial [Roseiflexaceae bacterium]|nr:glycosyltransferase family 39 protein [Roseiflexaceae bacterium]
MSGDALRMPLPNKTGAVAAAPWKIVLVMGLIGIISRWLLHGRLLYDQEAAGLVFAAFYGEPHSGSDVAPCGPLYLALARALLPLFGTPEAAFVAISVIASSLAFVAIYPLGAALMGELAGVLSVALLISSPLFWFFGTVGLPYACDTLIAIIAALLSWQVASGRRHMLAALALWLALACSLRPWAALLMLPLALCAALRAPRPAEPHSTRLSTRLLAVSALILACLPLIGQPIGGESAAPSELRGSTGDVAFLPHLVHLAGSAGWGLGLATLPALGALLLWALGTPGFGAPRFRLGAGGAWFY